MMKKILYILFILATFTSCIKEKHLDESGNGQVVEMKLRIGTKAVNEEDATIKNVRIIVLSQRGVVKFNESQSVENATSEITAQARVGENHFYVVCNETPAITGALNGVINASELESIKVLFENNNSSNSPVMFGFMKNVTVVSTNTGDQEDPTAYTISYTDADGNVQSGAKTLPIPVKRLVAKVSLSFIKKDVDFTVSDLSIKVIKLPKYSFLGEGKEYDTTDGEAENIVKNEIGLLAKDNTVSYNQQTQEFDYGEGDKVIFDDFFIPDYNLSDEQAGDMNYMTAIIVSGKCTTPDGLVINSNWRIDLMNGGSKIDRNKHYKIAATISGMGAVGIYADIVEMEIIEIPINWKPIDGLVIVSDLTADKGKNVNVWNNYSQYSGILKSSSNKTYKDIIFKYGSVIGISTEGDFTGGSVLWRPKTYTSTIANWADIPALSNGDVAAENTGENIQNGLGDPCRLVVLTPAQIDAGVVDNGQWRMATQQEYQHLINAKDGGSNSEEGFNAFHYNFLPNVVTRDASGVLTTDNIGRYWSGKSLYSFHFGAEDATKIEDPQMAQQIRCVRVEGFPASTFTPSGGNINHSGGSLDFVVKQKNVPYWKAVLPTGKDITLSGSDEGFFDGKVGLTITPLPDKYVGREFKINVTGYGLDGVIHNKEIAIKQYVLSHSASFATFAPAITDNLIPGEGGEYSITISVSGELEDKYYDTTKWYVYATASNDSQKRVIGTTVNLRGASVITIPANNTGDIRSITLGIIIIDFGALNGTTIKYNQSK